jgi:hypothetical protein
MYSNEHLNIAVAARAGVRVANPTDEPIARLQRGFALPTNSGFLSRICFVVTATITFLSLPTIQVDSLTKERSTTNGYFSRSYLTLTVVRSSLHR